MAANLLILPIPRLPFGHFVYGIASHLMADIDEAVAVSRLVQLSELPLTLGARRSAVLALAMVRPYLVDGELTVRRLAGLGAMPVPMGVRGTADLAVAMIRAESPRVRAQLS